MFYVAYICVIQIHLLWYVGKVGNPRSLTNLTGSETDYFIMNEDR
jgi:hypothetical protein